MKYALYMTRTAERDLTEAADCIEYVLKNPQAADDLLNTADEKISALSEFAERNAVANDPVLKAWGIRFVQVKNYLAFYTILEQPDRVVIVRLMYGKREWISILKQGFSLE